MKHIPKKKVLDTYSARKSVRATAKELAVSHHTIIKCLVSNGIYPTKACADVHRLLAAGWSDDDICNALGVSHKMYHVYMPYSKGGYCTGARSVNAERIEKCRKRKRDDSNGA